MLRATKNSARPIRPKPKRRGGPGLAWLPASGKGARPLSRPHARHGVLQAVDRHIQINVYVARRNEDRVLLLLNRLQPPDARRVHLAAAGGLGGPCMMVAR